MIRRLLLSAVLMLSTLNAHAGKDPIGWSMSGSVPAVTRQNHGYALSFILTNNLPFTMPTPLQISNNSTPLGETTLVDNCSGKKLTPGQTCDFGLVLIPKSTGKKTLSAFMEYGKNKVQIPRPIVTTTTEANGVELLQGIVLVGFPTAILTSTTYPLSFEFKNNTASTLTGLTLSQSPGTSAGYTQSSTTCTSSLAAGANCTINGTFTTTATTGSVNVGYTMTNGSITGKVDSASVVNNTTGSVVRTVNFVNNCSADIWFGSVSANVNGNGCKSDSDCANGSVCGTTANGGAGYCFYITPTASNGSFVVSNGGGTAQVLIPSYNLPLVWSGAFFGRTGCTSSGCTTADCGGGTGACPIGVGADQPATQAEMTLVSTGQDNYDVTIINGLNAISGTAVGIEITPSSPVNTITASQYSCSSPGAKTQTTTGLGSCAWTFSPPSPAYQYKYVVAPLTNAGCTSDAGCSGGSNVCGLNYNKSTGTLNSYCGTLSGFLNANQVCSFKNTNLTPGKTGSSANPGDAYFSCDTAIPTMSAYSYWAMYSCQTQSSGGTITAFGSCYTAGASGSTCCGCVDWQNVGGVTVPSYTGTCKAYNTAAWTSTGTPDVQDGLTFLKTGCPTAYTYQYDDASSLFKCTDIGGSVTQNRLNYTITFCPT